ncbi:MAG: ribosome-associated translation inhibitor RaiA [Thermoguttaceae bacterium]|nr:ribosome-associated translation inhibitor RaiA [Thermoguttaceae bacterium]MBP3693914.1 ribosome-associated translation inhibitor RaiA [Thermoguttaceae bacterium]
MQITFSVRRGTLSTATSEKIQAKIEKLNRFYDRISSVEVMADLESKDFPELTLLLKTEPKKEFVVQAQAGDLLTSLDEALKKMEQQLKKFKEKLTDTRPEQKAK